MEHMQVVVMDLTSIELEHQSHLNRALPSDIALQCDLVYGSKYWVQNSLADF